MAKNKTKVVLPGSMANLAHRAQSGIDEPAPAPQPQPADHNDNEPVAQPSTSTAEPRLGQPQPGNIAGSFTRSHLNGEPTATNDEKDRTAPAAKKLPKADGKDLAKQYTIAKDNGEDSWNLFLDLAKNYKERDSKLATVYIDSDLKSVLDRLKSANSIKMPSTAILSAIVARFVFDHEQDIKNAIFGESLL